MRRRRYVTRAGVQFIAGHEGFSSRPYRDPVGVWTIGYGETKGVGPRTRPWSRRKARRRLRRRLERDYAPTVRMLGVPPGLIGDALTSFVYNVGPGALSPDTGIGDAVRRRQWKRVADELLKWDKAGSPPRPLPGLTRRRREEAAMVREGARRLRRSAQRARAARSA